MNKPLSYTQLPPITLREERSPLRSLGRALFRTDDAAGPMVLRLSLALVMFPHGAQKVFGWFGGGGPEGTIAFFDSYLGLPAIVAVFAMLAELGGSLMLAFGLGTRLAAISIGAVMIGAVVSAHLPYGFFMDWGGSLAGEGFEYHLLVLGMVAALVITGGGRASLDRVLARRLGSSE
jgi:putative oxidoreductase